ncbi:MAG: TonB-dependent receptor [Sphingomonadales bacterium]|nr:TonB-dependent receptor [Sphingomonadales bacterium]
MSKSLIFIPLLLSSTAASTAAFADDAPGAARAPDAAADPMASAIIVTATRMPTPIDEVPAAVTVLDKAAIDRMQDLDVAGLLLRTPGISLSRNGGFGTDMTLRIRGAEGDQTVVVLDGVKLSDPASPDGSFNLGNLLTGDAARVEVLRGPQSTLWGSQAIGGVVNVVTPLAARPLEGSFDVEAGSRRTVDARAALGGRDGPITWRLAGETFTTDGVSALDSRFGGQERDGYANQSATGRVTVDLAAGVSLDLRGYYAHGRTDIDGYSPSFQPADTPEYERNRQWLGYAGLNADLLGGRLRNRVGFSYTDTDRDNFDPRLASGDTTTFHAEGNTRRIDYQGTLALAEGWNAVFGVEHEHSRFASISPQFASVPAQGRATLTDEYLQISGMPLANLTLTGGVRHDNYSSYGSHALFSAGAAWALPTGTVLRASYGEGFKAPSLYQLYSEYGNSALRPTTSRGWELGLEQKLWNGRVQLGGAYFERRTRQQVVFISCFGTPTGVDPLCDSHALSGGYYRNVARTVARGVELTASARPVDALALDANWSWTLAEDRTPGATNGNWLPRRPRQQGNASATYTWPFGLATGVALRWAGHSFDDTANRTRLAGYALVDLRAELPLGKRFTLFARAENLFDEYYETAYRFGTLGRSVYAGLRARM